LAITRPVFLALHILAVGQLQLARGATPGGPLQHAGEAPAALPPAVSVPADHVQCPAPHGEGLAAGQEATGDQQAPRAVHGGVPSHPETVPHPAGLDGPRRERLGVREAHEGLEVHIEAVQPAGEDACGVVSRGTEWFSGDR